MDGIPPAPQGVLQIEATFGVDATASLNMSTMDSPQAVPQITIVKRERPSSQADGDHMMQKAEEFCAESESNKAKTETKCGLRRLLLHFAHNSEQGKDVALLTIGNGIFEARPLQAARTLEAKTLLPLRRLLHARFQVQIAV